MPSESRGTVSPQFSGSASFAVANSAPPGPQSYVLVAVGFNVNTASVTGITGGTGTFIKLAAINSTARRLELWLGYNFGSSAPTTITVTRAAGTVNTGVVARTVDVFASATTAPSFTAGAGNTATSASADSGSLTPAIGDLLFSGYVETASAASTARTHAGNSYLQNNGLNLTTGRLETGWCEAVAAASSKEVWTLAASDEWAAIQAKITPPAPPTPTAALLLKGMTTQAADAASPY